MPQQFQTIFFTLFNHVMLYLFSINERNEWLGRNLPKLSQICETKDIFHKEWSNEISSVIKKVSRATYLRKCKKRQLFQPSLVLFFSRG